MISRRTNSWTNKEVNESTAQLVKQDEYRN